MNKHLHLILAVCVPALALTARAEQDVTNRLNLSARVGFNMSARFSGVGSFGSSASSPRNLRRTPDGHLYNYDDGYVLTDVSENAGGMTWYWGYDNASQVSGNSIQLSRSTTRTTAASEATEDAGPTPGVELTYSRQLGVSGKWRYGLDAAVSYMGLNFSDRSRAATSTTRTTDMYGFMPGTTPPSGPYEGSYNGPGFVIFDTPGSSFTSTAPGDSVTGKREFEADLWGFRLGPYLEFPLGTNWDVSLSAGVALGILNGSGRWSDTLVAAGGTMVRSGRSSEANILFGGYVSANVAYRISEHWSATAGVQFQSLSSAEQDLGGRKVELDLAQSLFLTFGVTWNF